MPSDSLRPHRVVCPRCQKEGFVRVEREISHGDATTHYFCGSCLHKWHTQEPPHPITPT